MCNSLAAWYALTSEFAMVVDYIVFFVDLHVRCQQQTNKSTLFAAKLRFAFFRSCMSFSQHVYGEDECFGNLMKSCECGNGNGW